MFAQPLFRLQILPPEEEGKDDSNEKAYDRSWYPPGHWKEEYRENSKGEEEDHAI